MCRLQGFLLFRGSSGRPIKSWRASFLTFCPALKERHQHRHRAHGISYRILGSSIMSVAPSSAALRCCRQALKFRSSITTTSPCTRLASTACTSSIRQHRRRKTQTQSLGRRWESTDSAAVSPKISGIVDQISQLTLLETADLVQSLKV